MRARTILQAPATIPGSATVANGAAVDFGAQKAPFLPNYTAVAVVHLAAAANGTIRIQTSPDADGDTWTTVADQAVTTARTGVLLLEFTINQRVRLQVLGSATGAGTAALEGVIGN
jgi:hypothetical protein